MSTEAFVIVPQSSGWIYAFAFESFSRWVLTFCSLCIPAGRVIGEAAKRLAQHAEEAKKPQLDVAASQIRWQWSKFDSLSTREIYEAIALRERVFIVEQNCPYLDCDGKDQQSHHLLGWASGPSRTTEHLIAYLRVVPPGLRFIEVSIGRVVVAPECRRQGVGLTLMKQGLQFAHDTYGNVPVRIAAQAHLQKYYGALGFVTDSDVFLEDDIPHVEMIKGTSRA